MPPRHHLTFVAHAALSTHRLLRPVPISTFRRGILTPLRALPPPPPRPRPRARFSCSVPAKDLSPSAAAASPDNSDTNSDSNGGGGGSGTPVAYDFAALEKKWQARWRERGDFTTPGPDTLDTTRPKFYALDMFPYPSGAGLHVGHPEGYTATDIMARLRRKQGYNVLHPMGWDAFGLPAEQYAVQTGTHPADTTERNIARFRHQLQALGFSYDWAREVRTTDPAYYKWTQWIFLKLWERGLAYQDDKPVNWCPELGTVLANEEVVDGVSERGGFPVERRQMKQWVLRITEYAERLLEDLELVDWPESVKDMQRNWIGKSVGAELRFPVDEEDSGKKKKEGGQEIPVFTTRPETVCGVSYLVVAPEWDGLQQFASAEQAADVRAYAEAARQKSDRDRTGEGSAREKTGVWTGRWAINPINGERVQVWVADYVLGSYGTGAVMAVPAHDARDHEFAVKFALPIKQVVRGDMSDGPFTGDGEVMSWGSAAGIQLDGVQASAAKAQLMEHLEREGLGTKRVTYKLRDWLFSRQRYWGEPFPIVFVDGEAKAVSEAELPVELPEVESYKACGTGESPLATVRSWVQTTDRTTGMAAVRETNTMPQWAGSCWYYLRFIDPHNVGAPVDPALEKYWMPVDLYVGGVEHAVLHLLYARFWHKVLFDVGVVSTREPFQRLVNQGMILGEVEYTAYRRDDDNDDDDNDDDDDDEKDGAWVSAAHVAEDSVDRRSGARVQAVRVGTQDVMKKGDGHVLRADESVRVTARAHKMSKSRGNVVNPDAVIGQYGADALRLYLMFLGPLEQVKPWGTAGVGGMARFLSRAWRLVVDPSTDDLSAAVVETEATAGQRRETQRLVRRVGTEVEALRFNTAIAAMMEFVNAATKWDVRPLETLRPFLGVLGVFAPHVAEELWERVGERSALGREPWPVYRAEWEAEESKTIVVQVNGKVRSRMQVASSATEEEIVEAAVGREDVRRFVEAGVVKKRIYVPNKLVNLVVVATTTAATTAATTAKANS